MFPEPQSSPPPFTAGIPDATDATGPDRAITILVVDDEPVVRRIVCAMLVALGHHAFAAPDGEEALRIVSAVDGQKIDILLTDYQMPVLLGDELARRFHEACPEAGIILMSGNLPQTPRAPRCEFLAKPFRAETLREKVQAALPIGKGLDT